MYSLNRAQLIGNLTRDPELKQLSTGVGVCSFTVATNQVWNDQNGVRQEKAEFHDVVAWRKLAEIASQLLSKGAKVYVEGKIQTREWEAEDGSKRRKTEIVAENLIMLDKKNGGMDRVPAGLGNKTSAVATGDVEDPLEDKKVSVAAGSNNADEDVTIDDLPF